MRIFLPTLLLLCGCARLPDGLAAVSGFDAERYLGTWYEIARLDHRFERGLEDVSATYSLREGGGLEVLNRGFDVQAGEWREIRGHAKFVTSPDVARLAVSFFGPFYGGYNVVDVDPEYRIALVAGPTRSSLWILARSPEPPAADIERLVRRAGELGFDTSGLIFVPHRRTP